MSHRIKKVQYLEGYSLKLFFDDGKNKIVDLADIVRRGQNLIAQLKDIDYTQETSKVGQNHDQGKVFLTSNKINDENDITI